MMTQTAWDSPKFTIDCVLANASTQLEADGCVLECEEDGHKLTTPGSPEGRGSGERPIMVGRRGGFYRHSAGDSHKGSQALDHGGSDPGEPK
jgi:hypothetical protein